MRFAEEAEEDGELDEPVEATEEEEEWGEVLRLAAGVTPAS